jgi:Ca2+-transporting ATPase
LKYNVPHKNKENGGSMKEDEEKFYNMSIDEVYQKLNTTKEGLDEEEALKRLENYGPNKLKEGHSKTLFAKFLDQFKNIMIIILLVAALLSGAISILEGESLTDSIIIIIVVLLNAIMGVVQESKAEKAIDSLKKLQIPFIKVKRNGVIKNINSDDLVIGDIVLIEAGDFVPADIRIIENSSLRADESALTGESIPVHKKLDVYEDNTMLADRKNMLYSGSYIVYGHGQGVVTKTGMNTELGKIALILSNDTETLTPLQKKMNEISKSLSIIVVVIGLLMVILGIFRNNPLLEVFMLAVSLAVAAIPEGLPAAITIILSIGVQKMAKEKSIIRKLSSVEALGSTEIICSDKTGTLTQNKMTVKEISIGLESKDADEVTFDEIKEMKYKTIVHDMLLCNDTKYNDEELLGDPTETALVSYAQKFGIEKKNYDIKHERVEEIPFDSERKMMSTINELNGEYRVYTKGAVESILNHSTHAIINGQKVELTNKLKEKILKINNNMSKKALRVLAFAYRDLKKIPEEIHTKKIETDLIYVGLIGMIDPPRDEAKDAVEKCFQAGMIPIMITGDNKDTAIAIASEIGIYNKKYKAITGNQLDEMDDETFEKNIEQIRVYARVSPENKLRIVKTWKKLGKTVAMTGDGVNDAPALKNADIGIGMGITGTEVSKSVSSMIIADDNFSTIVSAVEEGRRIYTNIQNVIAYLLASNLAEVIIIFFGTLIGHNIMLPIQLLWINLITDTIPAITLGFEKAEKNIMNEKPRKANEKFFTPFLIYRIMVPAILKSIIVLTIFIIFEFNYSHKEAMTISFIMLSFIELLFAQVMRSDKKLVKDIGLFSNKPMIIGTILTIGLQLMVIFIPFFRNIFSLVKLTTFEYLLCLIIPIAFAIVSDFNKVLIAKYFKKTN